MLNNLQKSIVEADIDLHFIRDRMGREVDFLILKDRKPWFMVEVKLSGTNIDTNLKYFSERLKIPGIQVVNRKNYIKEDGNIIVVSADQWLTTLP
ncbi:MAG: hypothetical protein PF503_07430 [Desulfobacula sp.]|nr:hypothetical protein [Desulfobacula sp.]